MMSSADELKTHADDYSVKHFGPKCVGICITFLMDRASGLPNEVLVVIPSLPPSPQPASAPLPPHTQHQPSL